MLDYKTYSPTELLDYCKVSAYDWHHSSKDTVATILAIVAIEKDPEELKRKIARTIEEHSQISIGKAIDKLDSISTTGKELQGDHDGVDALCYHLSGSSCNKGIAALQKVLVRFEEMERAKHENEN